MPDVTGIATKSLIAINAAFGLLVFFEAFWSQSVIAAGLIPGRFWLGNMGYDGILIPVWLTPVTSSFLHGGISHLLLNMIMLLLMGRWLEPVLGQKLFLVLYASAMLTAAATEVAASYLEIYGASAANVPAVGASGAISGLIAAYAMLFPRNRPQPFGPIPAKITRPISLLLGWGAINLMLALVMPQIGINIAVWSHMGGFVAGLALAVPLIKWKYSHS